MTCDTDLYNCTIVYINAYRCHHWITPAPEPVEVGGADVVGEAGAPAALPRHVQQVGGGAGRAVPRPPTTRPQVPRVRGAPAEGGGGRQGPGGGGGLRQRREAPAACTTRRVPSQLCSLVTPIERHLRINSRFYPL